MTTLHFNRHTFSLIYPNVTTCPTQPQTIILMTKMTRNLDTTTILQGMSMHPTWNMLSLASLACQLKPELIAFMVDMRTITSTELIHRSHLPRHQTCLWWCGFAFTLTCDDVFCYIMTNIEDGGACSHSTTEMNLPSFHQSSMGISCINSSIS